MIAAYRRLPAHPGVPSLLTAALLVRLSTPVLSLALLLAARDRLGSYGVAGLVLTGHALALAVCAPLGGRLADRFGARRTLTGYLAAHAAAYVLVLVSLHTGGILVTGAAALLGATTPPAGAVIRGAWPHLVPEAVLPTAYAADNALNELSFIVGPLLLPVLTLALPADGVVAAAGAALLAGTALLLTSPATHHSAPAPAPAADRSRRARLAGPLGHRPVLALLLLAAAGTFSFGCLRIATAAVAAPDDDLAGVLMALLSAGALAGTLGYGARSWPVAGRRLLAVLSAAEAALLACGALLPHFWVVAVLVTGFGLVTGPRDAALPALLAERAPARYRTEVFTWLNTFMWTGYGLGTAVAGHLTGPHGDGAAPLAAAAALTAATAALLALLPGHSAPKARTDQSSPVAA
ncbi:MFS transporter [Actinomadura kijaniata]|uniref:MFS transporter n=1 Tax=Actinomadura kijaniata TaxID=46161 RepID=UPI003F1B2B6E